MYGLISGKFPFKGETNKDLYMKIKRGTYQMPENLSLEGKSMLLKMLTRDPEKRWKASNLLNDSWLSETNPSILYQTTPENRYYQGTISIPAPQKTIVSSERTLMKEGNQTFDYAKEGSSPKYTIPDLYKESGNCATSYFDKRTDWKRPIKSGLIWKIPNTWGDNFN